MADETRAHDSIEVRQKLKIVAYSSAATFGGHEVMSLKGLRALLLAGHDVHLIHSHVNDKLAALCKELAADYPQQFSSSCSSYRTRRLQIFHTWLDWKALIRLSRELKASHADLVLALQGDIEQGSEALVAAALALIPCLSYIPMVMSGVERGIRLPRLRDFLCKPLYRLANRMIVISPTFAREARESGARDATVVYNCVDNVFFDAPSRRERARCQLGIEDGELISGFIGRIAYDQKGIDRLIETLRQDTAFFASNRMLVVGSGPDDQRLLDDLKVQGLEHLVIRRPWDDDRLSYFDAMDVFLCVSRFEGVPLTVLEASARRIPVVSTALPTLVDHLPFDFLDEPFDARDCLERIKSMRDANPQSPSSASDTVSRSARLDTFERSFSQAVVAGMQGAAMSPSQRSIQA